VELAELWNGRYSGLLVADFSGYPSLDATHVVLGDMPSISTGVENDVAG
jgi:hypothetical protein